MWQTPAAHPEFLSVLGSRGNFNVHAAVQRGHGEIRAKHCFPRREFGLVDQIVILDLEIRIFCQMNAQVQITGGPAVRPGFAAPGHPQTLPPGHAHGDFNLVGLGLDHLSRAPANRTRLSVLFARAPTIVAHRRAAQRNRADGTMHRLLQRDHNVAFDVAALFGQILLRNPAPAAKGRRAASARAEQLLEEIAEARRASKFELERTALPGLRARKWPASPALLPARRRAELGALLPIWPQLVVFFALVRIAENFVSLVDFLEFLLCPFLGFGFSRVGMGIGAPACERPS